MNSKFFLRRETYFVVFHNTTRFHRPNSHEQTIQIFLRHTLWKVIDNQIRSRFFIVFTLLLLRLYLLLLWLWLLFSLVRHFRPFRRILLLFLACNPILLLLLLIDRYLLGESSAAVAAVYSNWYIPAKPWTGSANTKNINKIITTSSP